MQLLEDEEYFKKQRMRDLEQQERQADSMDQAVRSAHFKTDRDLRYAFDRRCVEDEGEREGGGRRGTVDRVLVQAGGVREEEEEEEEAGREGGQQGEGRG